MEKITLSAWGDLMDCVAQTMAENAEMLCAMDASMGDGDLGLTMKKGFAALPEIYRALEEPDMGKRLTKAGIKMASTVPSTMGTLMASGWMEGGKCLVKCEAVDATGFARFLRGFANGISKRGKCAPGDRTVLDAIAPAADAAEMAAAAGKDLAATAEAALGGACEGLERTKEMLPKFGKAAVFSGKAKGVADQGAMAGMLLVRGLRDGAVLA